MRVVEIGIRFGQFELVRLSKLRQSGLDIHVVEVLPAHITHYWHRDTTAVQLPLVSLENPAPVKIWRILSDLSPGILLVDGYFLSALRYALLWGKLHVGVTTVLQTETVAQDRMRNPLVERAKGMVLRFLADHFVAASRQARLYLQGLGIPSQRITEIDFQCVDVDFYRSVSAAVRGTTVPDRHVAGIHLPEKYFLYVGRLAPVKNLDTLLTAYKMYRRFVTKAAWALVIVGAGELEGHLKTRVREEGIPDVIFTGALSYEDTAKCYALASCYVLPSWADPHSLTVAEAAASSLPLILSNRLGHLDKYLTGGNGAVFEPGSADELAKLLLQASQEWDIQEKGAASLQMALRHTPDSFAFQMKEFLNGLQRQR